jgi:histidyl-tRNA synthetase
LITLAIEVLKKAEIRGLEVKLSHAGLIRALLVNFGLSPDEQTKLFDQILDGDVEVLAKLKPEQPDLGRALASLLDLRGKSSGFLRNMKTLFGRDLPELGSPLDNFIGITDLLEALNVNYQVDITSGRGFEYYTGVMFRLFAQGEHIGGGGRYDALVSLMGGPDVPASGFAVYLDQVMNLMPGDVASSVSQKVLVKPRKGKVKEAFEVAAFLRDSGYVAEVHLGGREPTNAGWSLKVRATAPIFILHDLTRNKRFEARTQNELLTLLKTAGH